MKENREISVFVASSNELACERLMLGAWANEFDNHLEADCNIRVRLNIWEDYNNSFDGRRTQDHYNEELVKDSDVFIVLFRKKFGNLTVEEIEHSTEYNIRHRLAVFIPDGTIVEPSDEWTEVLSANDIPCVTASKSEDVFAAISGIISESIAEKNFHKEHKPLNGTLLYATVSADLPEGENRVRNLVRRMDAKAEALNKPRMYLFPYHTEENINRSHHYFGFVGTSADATAGEEIRKAVDSACSDWTPTFYIKDFASFRQTALGKYICDERQYFVPPLDGAFKCFESDLKDILLSGEIRHGIYKNIEILDDRAFVAGLEIDDYAKLLNGSNLREVLENRKETDEKRLNHEDTAFYEELIKGRIKTVLSVRIQLKNLILEEIRFFGYTGLLSKFEQLINQDNIGDWHANGGRAVEALGSLYDTVRNDQKLISHFIRLISLLYLWQSESIPAATVQSIYGNASCDYEDAQLLLFSLHFRNDDYNCRRKDTFEALKFFFSKASDDTDLCYNLQCGLDAIEPFIEETETDDVVCWLDYLKSYYGRITERSVRSDLLYCRLITAYLRRLSTEEESEELIRELKTAADRLWLEKEDMQPDNLYDLCYANNLIGAYYADRLDSVDFEKASHTAGEYLRRAYGESEKLYGIDEAEAAPLLSMVSHNFGWLYNNLNDKTKACEYYKKAYKIRALMHRVELLTDTGDILAETAVNYSSALLDLNRIQEALDVAATAVKLREPDKNIPEENHQALYMIALQIYGTVLLRVPDRLADGINALLDVYNWAVAHPHSKWFGYFMCHSGNRLHRLGIIQ